MEHWFWQRAGMRAGLAFGAATGGSLVADNRRMDPVMSALVRFVRRQPPKPQPIERTRADYAQLLALAGLRGGSGATAAPLAIPGLPPGREHMPHGRAAGRAPVGTLLYFFGGGFIMGSPSLRDGVCRRIAARTGLRVLAPGYRLAPEHPFPAAHDDARAALDWVRRQGWAGPLLVGGDSAGANLAASLAREGGVDGQVLVYPVVDMEETDPEHGAGDYPSLATFAEGYLLTAEAMRAIAASMFPPGTDRTDPRLSPIRADVSRAAPALVTVAGFDPLRDQGTAYAATLRRAGVRVALIEEDALVHGYADFAGMVPEARRAVDRLLAGIEGMLAA
jgi:acetyl esterase